MFTRRNTRLARLAAALIILALVIGVGGGVRPVAFAAESTSPITSATIDGSTFTMTTPNPAIPTDTGTIDYRVAVQPAANATSIQLRIKLSTETGTLLFSRTRYLSNLGDTPEDAAQLRVEQFTREVSELRLKPGTYHVVCEIAVATPSHRTEDALRDTLVVYDPDGPKVLLAPTLKVSAAPMRTAAGTFANDPSSAESLGRLEAVSRLAAWVNSDQQAAVTLAISPLLLEEWTDISDGYTLEGSEGTPATGQVNATEPTPSRYASALIDLLAATESGRLTIAAGGYADPDLTALASLDRTGDILRHYRRGALTFASDEATATLTALSTPLVSDAALTAPIATTVNDATLDELSRAGIDTAILAASAVSPDAKGALLRHESGLTVAAADAEISASLGSAVAPRSSLLAALNARLADSERDVPAVSLTEFGESEAATTATLSRLAELSSLPWVELAAVRELGAPAKGDVASLADLEVDESPWGGSVDAAAVARALDAAAAAELMTAGIELADPDDADEADGEDGQVAAGTLATPLSALDAALVAEHGIASVPSAARTAYTDHAATLASRVVGAVKLSVRSVTLPSVEGEVPITIVNDGETPLKVRLDLTASGGLTFIGTDDPERISEEILLEAGETFRKPAVALHNAPDGDLSVRVMAGSYVVTEESVEVGASYINMISTVGLVVLAGLALVAYVYSRVKRAPTASSTGGAERAQGTTRNMEEHQ